MSEREDRAKLRRATWEGQVVLAGKAKGALYADLSLPQRLVSLSALNERAWLATGKSLPTPSPRSEWPGEVFELKRHV